MNGQQASIPTRGSHEQHRATNARLHEPWHLLQVACVVVVVLALFLFIGSILLDFANIRLICRAVHEQMPAMERRKDEWRLSELSSQLVTIITTEHYNLQTGRSMTVADANGRCTLFIGAVSGALIAIAFTGQVSRMGTAFFVFSLVLLPSLLLMGLITFERVLQSAIEDLTYARAIMRIRSLYLELAPQLRPYFVLAADDERRRPRLKVGLHPSWWQVFLTTAGMIAALNSVLVGVFVGLLLSALFTFPLQVCTSVGVVSFLVSLSLHQRYQWGQWRRLEQDLAALAQAQRT